MDNFIHLNHLHVFKRCIDCDEVRENLKNLSRTLKETSIAEVVIAEADCCIETDLCDTLDRKTKCINDEISEGMWSMKFSQYVIHLNSFIPLTFSIMLFEKKFFQKTTNGN